MDFGSSMYASAHTHLCHSAEIFAKTVPSAQRVVYDEAI